MDHQKGIKTMVKLYMACYNRKFFPFPLTKDDINIGYLRIYVTPYSVS